ncbi:protein AF-9 [Anopheles sinensis]|uniref:Protein AF-9 n=1 Tax=Anopheles sinensis TaxID=74873 RepID=A0A084WPQ9_ANOSI|nr:protein AF-9 [Anopheles sinensis]
MRKWVRTVATHDAGRNRDHPALQATGRQQQQQQQPSKQPATQRQRRPQRGATSMLLLLAAAITINLTCTGVSSQARAEGIGFRG